MYDCVIPVLTWWRSARLKFSEDSLFINYFPAICMALRLLATTLLVETPNAGNLSFRKEGSLRFLSKTSWLGLNPWTLWSVFLPLIAYASAISKLQCVSSRVFFIFPNMPLCRSFNPLLHGLSAGVVRTMIFKFCAMSLNYWLLNPQPLSVRNPKIYYPVFKCSIDDVRPFFTRNPDSDTIISNMFNQVKYCVAIDFFDIHGNIFVKIWS